ncbi:MAG: hypothetical protein V1750_08165 [Acidobacteriota bacterium]
MDAVKVGEDGTIQLPKEFLRLFPASSELLLWARGDTLVLKRLAPIRPCSIAERATGDSPMPLVEISREVQRARRERRNRGG